ncbi:uncharacterized protein (TIGR02246 family) [Cryobacterium sp. MP_M5]|uniref:YybH family protein n=1 Tax=unclassified Cryobacterium TaxID=2649013 RepID=UPI0018CA3DA4|nr:MULTISPECIES: nuclear transport factor 2 family protein [unclassified Cryobacterium]MBG6060125.1 uncharacterized protein (TIGR02246 family) [Cryobacterium sp. MP_M3]MEC5177899.1 uncharacterized protein (TIGR02246 family) [Cryobacterium sp. MP_M5]
MSTDHTPVTRALEAYAAAVRAKDVDAFADIYAEDVHVFDAWGRWEHVGIAAWRAMATEWFGSLGTELVDVTFAEVRSSIGSNVAFASAAVTYAATSAAGESLRSMTNRITVGLERQDGTWKVVHEHTSLPIDLASGRGIFSR